MNKKLMFLISGIILCLSLLFYVYDNNSYSYNGPQTKQEEIAQNELSKAIFFETCGSEFGDIEKFMSIAKNNVKKANSFVSVEMLKEMYPYVKDVVSDEWGNIPENQKMGGCVAASIIELSN